ncbi:MAG: AAA family ATPase [Candidatus Omnitrophota bacterium]
MKEYSPFTPGNPVPLEFFVGREKQINEIIRYANQSTRGKLENVFLSGDRGIGKSSLATFCRYLLQENEDFLTAHVFLGGTETLTELVRRVFEVIYKDYNKKSWFKKITNFFDDHVQKVGIFSIDVTFHPPEKKLAELVNYFPDALYNITEKIKEDKKALFIILDDINGFCKRPDFSNWYKSFVDSVAVHQLKFPVFFMLIGLPEIRDALSEHQPSLLRIFRVIEIENLGDSEVRRFFEKAFDSVQMKIEPDALNIMTALSNGLPILMHEIGDAVFWNANDHTVNRENVISGILEAADRIGKKYLDPKIYRAIRSEKYRTILRKIGEVIQAEFHKRDILNQLNLKEQKVFGNFLNRMTELGMIVKDIEKGRGYYKFVNKLYPIYIWLESEGFKKKTKQVSDGVRRTPNGVIEAK